MLTDLSRPLKNYKQSAEAELAKSAAPAPDPEAKLVVAEAIPSEPATPAVEPENATPQGSQAEVANIEKSAPGAKSTASISAVPAAGAPESDAEGKKQLRQVQTSAREVAAFWLGQKLSDARAYRIARVAATLVIENAPPANNGVTQINPPGPERLKFFQTLVDKNDHKGLIPELEKTLARAPFWLDGQFLVVKSLRALGNDYDEAVQTVKRELNNFLTRLPDIIELSFSDETAFASDQTRMWLNAEVLVQPGDSTGTADSSAAQGEDWNTALAAALKLSSSGDNDKALELMRAGIAGAVPVRDQVYWRCALAELLLQTGKVEAAAMILEQVGEQANTKKMAQWEPRLLTRIYNLLHQSYQKQQKLKKDDKALQEKVDQAFEQLCRFDPLTAISAKGG